MRRWIYSTVTGFLALMLSTLAIVALTPQQDILLLAGGGNGGVSSITTSCPASGPSKGAVTISGLLSGRTVSGGADTLATTDCGSYVRYQNATSTAVTVPSAAALGAGWYGQITVDSGAGTVTLTGSSNFNTTGSTTLTATAGQSIGLSSDGTTILAYPGKSSGGGGSGANPTATAGPTAVNGSATTFMRSDGAPAVQLGTTGQPGLVQPDGSTITVSGGVITAIGATPTPCGTNGQFQYNNSTVCGGAPMDFGVTHSSNITITSNNLYLAGATGSLIVNSNAGSVQFGAAANAFIGYNAAASLRQGAADGATPVAQTFGYQSATGSNVNGVNTTINGGGRSTGSGNSGDYIIQTGGTGAAASTQNTFSAGLTIKGNTHRVVAANTIGTGGFTVGGLPTGVIGDRAYVTDQLTVCAAVGAALTGGGAVVCPAFYNGTAWVGG